MGIPLETAVVGAYRNRVAFGSLNSCGEFIAQLYFDPYAVAYIVKLFREPNATIPMPYGRCFQWFTIIALRGACVSAQRSRTTTDRHILGTIKTVHGWVRTVQQQYLHVTWRDRIIRYAFAF
jgi:hypothetical protein